MDHQKPKNHIDHHRHLKPMDHHLKHLLPHMDHLSQRHHLNPHMGHPPNLPMVPHPKLKLPGLTDLPLAQDHLTDHHQKHPLLPMDHPLKHQ